MCINYILFIQFCYFAKICKNYLNMYSSNNYSVSIHFKTLSCKIIYTHNFYFTVNIGISMSKSST